MKKLVLLLLALSGCDHLITNPITGIVLAKSVFQKNHDPEVVLIQWVAAPDEAVIRDYKLKEREVIAIEGFNPWYVYKVKDEDQVVAELEHHPSIAHIELDLVGELTSLPADPFYGQQWALYNANYPTYDINHYTYVTSPNSVQPTGTVPIIAMIDSGVLQSHPDLWRKWYNDDCATPNTDEDGNGYLDDCNGVQLYLNIGETPSLNPSGNPGNNPNYNHGTHTAGIALADYHNADYGSGVCRNCQLMTIKVFTVGGGGTATAVGKAIQYAAIEHATVANISVQVPGYSLFLDQVASFAESKGLLLVCSAGNANNNNDSTPVYPSCFTHTNIISVGATMSNGYKASFSNYGAVQVDLAAPGYAIRSTLAIDPFWGSYNGTSQAAPHVAGVAGMLAYKLQKDGLIQNIRSMTPIDAALIKGRILNTTIPIQSWYGKSVSGGLLDMKAALQ